MIELPLILVSAGMIYLAKKADLRVRKTWIENNVTAIDNNNGGKRSRV